MVVTSLLLWFDTSWSQLHTLHQLNLGNACKVAFWCILIIVQACLSFLDELICVTHGFMSETHHVGPFSYILHLDKFWFQSKPIEAKSAWAHSKALIKNPSLFRSAPCALQECKEHSLSPFPFLVPNCALQKTNPTFEHTPLTRRSVPSLSAWVHPKGLKVNPLVFHNAPCTRLTLCVHERTAKAWSFTLQPADLLHGPS